MPEYKSWKIPLLKERNNKIRRLRAEGVSLTDLAERFGLTRSCISVISKERKNG